MIKPEEDILGCQVFCAYSTLKSLCGHTSCWGFWGRQDGTVHWECSKAPPVMGEMARHLPGTDRSCWVEGSPGACSLPVLGGEGRTYTCKHGLLLSWSCRAIHHQFDMCSAGNIYFSSWVWDTQFCHCFVVNVLLTSLPRLTGITDGVAWSLWQCLLISLNSLQNIWWHRKETNWMDPPDHCYLKV